MIFEAKQSRLKLRLLLSFPLFLTGLAIWLALNPESIRPHSTIMSLQTKTVVASLICLGLLGGAYYVFNLWRFHDGLPDPWLRIDEQGVLWQEWSADAIAWSNIEKIIVAEPSRRPYLKIYLRDPAASPALYEPQARLARNSRSALKHDLLILLPNVSKRMEELESTVRWFLEGQHGQSETFA